MNNNKNTSPTQNRPSKWYAHYVLFVLVIVYVFNLIDRNILSILSGEIQRDLGISDAELGFLYGTVFAVFYSVCGIPLGRFADVWVRRSLIAGGLAFWSVFTVLSGLARSFPALSICRMGVGIGEASASPAAYSLLADYYAPKVRATVIAIYTSGVYIGSGIGLFLGGYLLETWEAMYPVAEQAPLGLKGWQATFMAVGIPGLLLAIWVRTLREPVRGAMEGLVEEKHPAPFSVLASEFRTMIPLVNLVGLHREGTSLKLNACFALAIAAIAWALVIISGNPAQWIALGIGLYIVMTWAQSLATRDYATFAMVFKSHALVYVLIALPSVSVVLYGMGFWIPPLMLRLPNSSPAEIGMYIGLSSAFGGFLGVVLGGALADYFKLKHPSGRLLVGYLSVAGSVPFGFLTIYSDTLMSAAIYNFFFLIFATASGAVPVATATDLIMPRMRGTAGALIVLVSTFVGLALGPFIIGHISDTYASLGLDPRASLQKGLSSVFLIYLVTIVFLTLAWRKLPEEEAGRLDRARSLGEFV